MKFEIKELDQNHRNQVYKFMEKEWGALNIVSLGKIYNAKMLNGFVALKHEKVVGFVLYHIENNECEIVAIYSDIENKGIGTALINIMKNFAIKNNCKRLFLITTNDNIRAIAFYQKKGFSIIKVYVDSVKNSRKLKPQIPLVADNGIPIRDEIEFEIKLVNWKDNKLFKKENLWKIKIMF